MFWLLVDGERKDDGRWLKVRGKKRKKERRKWENERVIYWKLDDVMWRECGVMFLCCAKVGTRLRT